MFKTTCEGWCKRGSRTYPCKVKYGLIYFTEGGIELKSKGYFRHRKLQPKRPVSNKTVEEIVRELKEASRLISDYREQSLRIHGLICAKCGREFDYRSRHLLTVHHKNGDPSHNPPDGSNWENLCIYCHDDEHSRGLLSDYLKG